MNEKAEEPNEKSKPSTPSGSPPKPPRPPPPNLKRPPSIAQHLEALQGLRPERVRWFVKEDNKKWTPFNGSDSLAIEACYRRIVELEKSSKDEDPTKPLNTTVFYDLPIVKGRLFEVDVVAEECTPIYWKDHSSPVCRGTWFMGAGSPDSWQPISEEDAEQIENSHQNIWRAMGLYVGPEEQESKGLADKQAMGRLQLKGYYVQWNDMTDIWLHWDDIKSRIIRGVGNKIGLGSSGMSASPLQRGYHTDAIPEDQPPDISHVVFVVHGIGQLLHMSNIVRSANDIRTSAGKVLEKGLEGFPEDQRVEFLPVEWRSSLKLDEGTIECITPSGVSGLRKVLNTSMMDIMYYTSPFYRYEIINGLRDELNRLYTLFCDRNPSFAENHGKVSLIAHSLGSVITYDILSLWDIEVRNLTEEETAGTGFLTESLTYLSTFAGYDDSSDSDPEGSPKRTAPNKRKENIRVELAKARNKVMELEALLKTQLEKKNVEENSEEYPYALKFKVENLFCIGSPLAVFLALRGLRPQDDVEDHVLPKSVCKKMHNIYHPADPVAYRLEPLISVDYSSIPPIQLHRFDKQKVGYAEDKKPATDKGGWKIFNYRVGYSKQKSSPEEPRSRSNSNSDSDNQDEMVIVGHAVPLGEGNMDQQEGSQSAANGGGVGEEKKGGWMSSWFGVPRKAVKAAEWEGESSEDGATVQDSKKKQKCEYIVVPSKVLSDRFDYVLREGYMESNYWSAVTSHVSYWTSCDVARFVLENTLALGESTGAQAKL